MFRQKIQTAKKVIIALIFTVISSLTIGIGAQAQDTPIVSNLAIVNYPETVQSFVDFSFSIEARDQNNNLVTNYDGTVIFSSETDTNAELPGEYTFTPADQGEKIFNESYFFTTAGTQKLTVTDKNNPTLTASVNLTVSDEPVSNQGNTINLNSPSAETTTNSTITVRGQTTPGVEVKIFNGTEILGTTNADLNGNFEFKTGVLPDGTYQIKATTASSASQTINVIINTQTPGVDFIEATPQSIAPGGTVKVTVRLQDQAREVKAILNNIQTPLVIDEINPKQFNANLVAPLTNGVYPLTLSIEDNFGNMTNNVATNQSITVTGTPTNDPVFNIPSQVTGVSATGSDQRITLTWQAAQAASGIKNYAIYYGTQADSLPYKIETFDNQTTWYIPNLTNGQTYYFQIFAIDTQNNRSDLGSQLLASSPSLIGSSTLHGSADGQVIVNQTSETGPAGLIGLAISSLFGAKFLRRKK